MIKADGLQLIKQSLNSMSKAERNVAEYIISNSHQIHEMSITRLAKMSNSSAATIVRLCKRLNIDGFQELKLRVIMEWTNRSDTTENKNIEIHQELSVKQILEHNIEKTQELLSLILMITNPDDIKTAAERIYRSRSILIGGVGASGIVAIDLMQKLQRIGLSASYYPDMDIQVTAACNLTASDACIGISYSGKNRGVKKLIELASSRGAYTVSLTGYGNNEISKAVQTPLYVPAIEPLVREAATMSRIAQLFLVDILFSTIITIELSKSLEALKDTYSGIQSLQQ